MMRRGLLAALLALAWTPALAQPEFFKGRQIDIIIGDAPGTGYDQWARMLGRFMSRYIPGEPVFVPRNMPGAGGTVAAKYLANVAARDGTVMGMLGRNLFYVALSTPQALGFDPLSLNFVGSPEVASRVCAVIDTARVKKAEDLFEHEVIMAGLGAGSGPSSTARLMRNLLGMKFKVVEGYKSGRDGVLAIERGEVQGICQSLASLRDTRPGWLESGRMRVLFNTERTPLAEFGAPSIFAFAKSERERRILALHSSSVEFSRPLALPPHVPAERVALFRQAFEQTVRDPEFVAQMEKMHLQVSPTTGAELTDLARDIMASPRELVDQLGELSN